MKIMKLKINHLYMFEDFEIEFMHPRKVRNLYRDFEKVEVSNINVNDINIILGANAAGKTALGKCLLIIQQLIKGQTVEDLFHCVNCMHDHASISVEYIITHNKKEDVTRDYVFTYDVVFSSKRMISEQLSYFDLTKGKSYQSAVPKVIANYAYQKSQEDQHLNGSQDMIQSIIFTSLYQSLKDSELLFLLGLASSFGYSYAYSGSRMGKAINFGMNPHKMIRYIESFIKQVDPRIDRLETLSDFVENAQEIEFKLYLKGNSSGIYVNLNKHHPEFYDLKRDLSSGTIESLAAFVNYIEIRNGGFDTVYMDEQLTHIHFDLEKELLALVMTTFPKTSQLFYTSHNPEIMKMNLPITFYYIMYKDYDGYIKVLRPSEHMRTKNDRDDLYEKVMNDYFNTSIQFDFGDFYDEFE